MDMLLIDQRLLSNGPIVIILDNSTIQVIYSGILHLPQLPSKVKVAYKFPNIAKSLISILDLCDEGDSAIFTKHNIFIWHNSNIILQGKRDYSTGLWLIPIY